MPSFLSDFNAIKFIRFVLGVIAGLAGAVVLISVIQMISNNMYPLPEGRDKTDPIVFQAYVYTLPIGAFLLVLTSYVFGSLVGGFVATFASKQYPLPAIVVSGILTVGAVKVFQDIPHPTWFMVISVICFLPMALIGARLTGQHLNK